MVLYLLFFSAACDTDEENIYWWLSGTNNTRGPKELLPTVRQGMSHFQLFFSLLFFQVSIFPDQLIMDLRL